MNQIFKTFQFQPPARTPFVPRSYPPRAPLVPPRTSGYPEGYPEGYPQEYPGVPPSFLGVPPSATLGVPPMGTSTVL